MTDQKTKLAEIKARLEAAMPGPWDFFKMSEAMHDNFTECHRLESTNSNEIIGMFESFHKTPCYGKCDLEFISSAPADLAYLLTLVERQAKEIERLKEFEWMYKDLCK